MIEQFVNKAIAPEMMISLIVALALVVVGWTRMYSKNASTLLALGPTIFGFALLLGVVCAFFNTPILITLLVSGIGGVVLAATMMLLKGWTK